MSLKQYLVVMVVTLSLDGLICLASIGLAQGPQPLKPEERQELERELETLEKALDGTAGLREVPDHFADASIFAKAVAWALRYDTQFTPADVALLRKGLERGQQRLLSMKDKK